MWAIVSKSVLLCAWIQLVVSFEPGVLKHVIQMLSNIDRRLKLGFRLPTGAL